jgi:hypothetical protein
MTRNFSWQMNTNKKKLLISAFLVGWIGIVIAIGIFGWSTTWNGLMVPAMPLPFADMRTVQGSLESTALGLNPQIENPGDPWDRRMNYPLLWVGIAEFFNFHSEISYLVFVSIMVSLYVYCCYRILLNTESVFALLIIFSGSSLLAVERGNNDLAIFTLLYLSAYVSPLTRTVPLLVAVALKIYPIMVLPALIKEKANAAIFGTFSFILILFMWQELGTIRAGTPRASMLSYGSVTIATSLESIFSNFDGNMLPFRIHHALVSFMLIVSVLIVYASNLRFFDVSFSRVNEFNNRLFLFGALIFTGTFLISGNWDYRLIFLLLCVPYIAEMQNSAGKSFIFGCILVSANYVALSSFFGVAGVVLNLLAKCILFVLLGSIVMRIALNMVDPAGLYKRFIVDRGR